MRKYLSVFNVSYKQEFAYRVNFIMWRVRNIFQIILVFFLWDSIFSNIKGDLFGYDRGKILTYVFLLLVVRAVVLSTRAIDVAGEISRGDLNGYLTRPLNYIYYWFSRDFSTKTLNLVFAIVETAILYAIIKPPFFLQTGILELALFFVSLVLSAILYFIITFIVSMVPFWIPEAAWGVHFLFTLIFTNFLSGSLFPIDVLPEAFAKIVSFTPFPYLVFYPIQIYLGKIQGFEALKILGIIVFWLLVSLFVLLKIWKKGLKVYQAYGG